jgi:hypothetical protein
MWSITGKIGLSRQTKKPNIFSTIVFDSLYSPTLVSKTAVTGYNVYKIDASSSALNTINVPSYSVGATINAKSNFTMYYLCIGGGGAGAGVGFNKSFGGGGGAFIEGSISLVQDTSMVITFTTGGTDSNGNGYDSSIIYGSTTVIGGRGGGAGATPNYGGSGCGGSQPTSGTRSGQAGFPPGTNGGIGRYQVGNYYGGGGGGAGGAGNNQNAGTGKAATAGTGINLLTGSTVFCAGGPGRGFTNGTGGGTTYGCGSNGGDTNGYRGVIYFAIPTSAIP